MASIAMSRAALEQGLKERLGRQGDGTHIPFRDLTEEARKYNILGRTGFHAAKNLAKDCNELLHEKPVRDDTAAFKILVETRSLLEEIYSAEGGY